MESTINKLDDLNNTELYNRMEDNIDIAESSDNASKTMADPVITKILGEKECPVQNCQLRLSIPELKKQLTEEKKKVRDLTAENENYRNALHRSVPEQQRQNVLVKATTDHLVQVMIVKVKDLEVQIKQRDMEIHTLQKYADDVTEQKNEYLSTLELDKNLKDKYQRFKIIEEQTKRMLAIQQDAQTRFNKYDSEYRGIVFKIDKVYGNYNELVKQYKHIQQLIKDSEMIAKGFRMEPVKPVQEKKKSFFGFKK